MGIEYFQFYRIYLIRYLCSLSFHTDFQYFQSPCLQEL